VDMFDELFGVFEEDVEVELRGKSPIAWANYWLNPRILRGSDFLMRYAQGAWSEQRLKEACNETENFYALPYGPRGTAPDDDVRATELYLERLEAAGLGQLKRPDLLIFPQLEQETVEVIVKEIGKNDDFEKALEELPFTLEDEPLMQALLSKTILAVECENSLWVARMMPHYGAALKPMKRLGAKPGLKKNAVLPTVIIKEQDLKPLLDWQAQRGVPIHVWHAFFDMAFGLSLNEAVRLVREGFIEPRAQVFQASGGQTTTKTTYNIYYHYAYELGEAREQPALIAAHIIDKNGHIMPYVKFDGGSMTLTETALAVLEEAERRKNEGE
jgi:hypothetical protein